MIFDGLVYEFGWMVVFHWMPDKRDSGGDNYVLYDREEEIIYF